MCAIMTFKQEYDEIKAKLAANPGSVRKVLTEAGVDRSTWTRWGQGKQYPRVNRWEAVRLAAEKEIARLCEQA